VPPAALLEMVTTSAAQVLRAADAGRIAVGAPADIVVVPARAGSAAESLLSCARADLALVVRGGTPVVGDVDMSPAFTARNVDSRPIVIDGRPKLMAARLVRRLERGAIQEPGVWSG
jgi:cytosine/adenosine deaminase-related metal-dependent hydrolase